MKVAEFFSKLEFTNKFLKELGRADIELVYFDILNDKDYSIKCWDDYVDFINDLKYDYYSKSIIDKWLDAKIDLSDKNIYKLKLTIKICEIEESLILNIM